MPSIKDIKKIKLNEEFIFFKADSIVSEIADSYTGNFLKEIINTKMKKTA